MLLYTWSHLDLNGELHSLNLAWKRLLKLFDPVTCLKQAQLDEVAQDLVWVSCISRDGDATASLTPMPMSDCLQDDKVFLPSNWNFPCKSCLLSPILSSSAFKKSLPP